MFTQAELLSTLGTITTTTTTPSMLALQALPGFIQAQTAGFEVIRMF